MTESASVEKARKESFRELLVAEFSYQTGGGLEILPMFDQILEEERSIGREAAFTEIIEFFQKNYSDHHSLSVEQILEFLESMKAQKDEETK